MKDNSMPFNILLDARKLGDGGIGVYIENLVDGFSMLQEFKEHKFNLTLLTPVYERNYKNEQRLEQLETFTRKWQGMVTFVPESARKYSIEEYLFLATRQRKQLQKTNVYHSPHYTLPFFLKVPSVVTIHDLIHLTHPDSKLHRLIGGGLIASAVSRANGIVTVSEASKKRILETFARDSKSIYVIPNALKDGIKTVSQETVKKYCERHYLSKPYYLFVGSDRQSKGFKQLYQAWVMLKAKCERENETVPLLAVLGKRFSSQTKAEIFSLGLGSVIHFIDYATSEELSTLYSGAEAVVIASREEGFGLMTLEAFACRTRIVTTPVPAIRETCGELAYYAPDFSAQGLYSALKECQEDREKEKRIIEGEKIVRQYTVENTARKTFQVYQGIVQKPSNLELEKIEIKQTISDSIDLHLAQESVQCTKESSDNEKRKI